MLVIGMCTIVRNVHCSDVRTVSVVEIYIYCNKTINIVARVEVDKVIMEIVHVRNDFFKRSLPLKTITKNCSFAIQ